MTRLQVSDEERYLLLVWRSVSPTVRALAAHSLIRAAGDPLPHEKGPRSRSLTRQLRRLHLANDQRTMTRMVRWARRQRHTVLGIRVGGTTVRQVLKKHGVAVANR